MPHVSGRRAHPHSTGRKSSCFQEFLSQIFLGSSTQIVCASQTSPRSPGVTLGSVCGASSSRRCHQSPGGSSTVPALGWVQKLANRGLHVHPDGPWASERPSRWGGWGMLTGEPARCDFTQMPRKERKLDFPQRKKLKALSQACRANGRRVPLVLPAMPRVGRAETEET